jgi:hypothetical protein
MDLYANLSDAVNNFSYSQVRFTKIQAGFGEFFENFNPENLQISGVTMHLDVPAGTCVITAFGRIFSATVTPLMVGKEMFGHVEFIENVGSKKVAIERFLITSNMVMTLAREALMPVSNFSNQQSLHILNLIHKGLSKPLIASE